ncbi:MAG: hypothetical protein AAF802_05215 [Planctomycetota bacterium]
MNIESLLLEVQRMIQISLHNRQTRSVPLGMIPMPKRQDKLEV